MRIRKPDEDCKNHAVGELLNCDACEDGMINGDWCKTRYPYAKDKFLDFISSGIRDKKIERLEKLNGSSR